MLPKLFLPTVRKKCSSDQDHLRFLRSNKLEQLVFEKKRILNTTKGHLDIFHEDPKLLGLGRKCGQINFGAFGVFSANLSAPILVL